MSLAKASPRVLTGRSTPSRLLNLSQPVDTTLLSDPARSLDISPFQNTSLHHYDQDVVRELSLPPDSVNPSATTRSRYPQSNGFPTHPQLEGPPSSFLTSPLSHHVPLEASHPCPRTLSVPAAPPSLFAHHGLPACLPPPPRTNFYSHTKIPPPQEPVPEADKLVSYFDSILRGSYSQMLSKNSDSSSRSELPQGGESFCAVPHCTASIVCPSAPRLRCSPLPPLAPELSLDDMLRADYLDTTLEEFLTSPLMQDDSPEETPFLETPGDEAWTSPMVDSADDSFGCGEMPLFGAAVKRQDPSSDIKSPESLDMLVSLQLYTPAEPAAPDSFESSKMDSMTPALDPLDLADMCTFPSTPALAPSALYDPHQVPSTHTRASSSAPSSSSVATATHDSSRPTKPIPTGTRRNITPASLVPIDAPTQPRQYVTPSATSRKALPAAFAKGKKRTRFEMDGGDDSYEREVDADQPLDDDAAGLDPNTKEAIEAKRRQNTLAARRSRQRKLEHVRELEKEVTRVTEDRDMWMARAYSAEAKLHANGLS